MTRSVFALILHHMPLTPRRPGFVIWIAALVFAWPVAAVASAKPSRPNIVLIISDDQGYGDSSANWKTDLLTPVMDGIARAGIRFTQFRVNPLCAPTCASVMTGLYSVESGMWRGPSNSAGEPDDDAGKKKAPKAAKGRKAAKAAAKAAKGTSEPSEPTNERRIRDEFKLLPEYLKAAGYATGAFGKWHLGADAKSVPNARGFDEFFGFLGGAHPYWIANNSRLQHNGKPFRETGGHTTDLFADRAIAFIKANKDRPFFCYLPFNAVHGPLHRSDAPKNSAKPEWLEFYEKRGVPWPRRDYNAVMSHAVRRTGDILATLRELGMEKNTLVRRQDGATRSLLVLGPLWIRGSAPWRLEDGGRNRQSPWSFRQGGEGCGSRDVRTLQFEG